MTQPHREAMLARVAFMEIYERWEKQQFGTKEQLLIGFYNECLDDDLRRAISSILESIQNAPPLADWQRWQELDKSTMQQ